MDIEMTKKCAIAMGIDIRIVGEWAYFPNCSQLYSPLTDDEQAMALVKKLRLFIDPDFGMPDVWQVASNTNSAVGEDLNHAIVECVSKMVKP